MRVNFGSWNGCKKTIEICYKLFLKFNLYLAPNSAKFHIKSNKIPTLLKIICLASSVGRASDS